MSYSDDIELRDEHLQKIREQGAIIAAARQQLEFSIRLVRDLEEYARPSLREVAEASGLSHEQVRRIQQRGAP